MPTDGPTGPAPQTPSGYKVNLSDVSVRQWTKSWKSDTKEKIYDVFKTDTRDVVAGWVIAFSGNLTWANGLHKNLNLSIRLREAELTADTILLSDAEWQILKSCVERVPATNIAEAQVVAQVLAAEQVALKPANE